MKHLRKAVPFEEFDYVLLVDLLKDYKKPRDKITKLLAAGDIIRIKKGLYIFGEIWRRHSVAREVLANLIYGPSYISKEYALAYYGIIPERVFHVTSMTLGKTKSFDTPIGTFTYEHLTLDRYRTGITLIAIDSTRSVLFAEKEKALADLVHSQKQLATVDQMLEHLEENLRIERSVLKSMNKELLQEIAEASHSPVLRLLYTAIRGIS